MAAGTINFSPIVEGSSDVDKETTLGEILEIINAHDPDKLRVEIGPDGDRLVITDLTEGEGSFKISRRLPRKRPRRKAWGSRVNRATG